VSVAVKPVYFSDQTVELERPSRICRGNKKGVFRLYTFYTLLRFQKKRLFRFFSVFSRTNKHIEVWNNMRVSN